MPSAGLLAQLVDIKIAPIEPYQPETADTGTDEASSPEAILNEFEGESGEKLYERVDKNPQLINKSFKYPDELKVLGIEGRVVARFIVNSKGGIEKIRIVTSPDERLSELTRKTLATWVFRPGEKDNQAVNTLVTLPLLYKLSEDERRAMIPPRRLVNANPEYPIELLNEHPSGSVQLGFNIDSQGAPINLRVLESSNPAFNNPALEAASQWRFQAQQAEPERLYLSTLDFAPPKPPLRPKLKDSLPEYPRKLRKDGISGDVLLFARINLPGFATYIETIHADHDALAPLAIKALRQWRFEEANSLVKRSQETEVYVRFRFLPSGKVHYIYPAW